jgi:hypothetical protein
MPLHRLPNTELRDYAKRSIEALEIWLRRLIDDELSSLYGSDYLTATKSDGSKVVSGKITKDMIALRTAEPLRYPRPIDAALLDDIIKIVSNPNLFEHFKDALTNAFPLGNEHVRSTLERLIPPRNALYHANPVSVRQVEQVVCYCNDTIASLKEYYERKNMGDQFNAPTIIRISDSLGNDFHSPQLLISGPSRQTSTGAVATVRAGDTLSLEIEVDPSFDRSEYMIKWVLSGEVAPEKSERINIRLESKHVGTLFIITVDLISSLSWHRHGSWDDRVLTCYRVLPPP